VEEEAKKGVLKFLSIRVRREGKKGRKGKERW